MIQKKKSEKSVVLTGFSLGIFVIIAGAFLLINSIGNVSGGWWSDITGNAAKNVNVSVGVTGTGNPPNVTFISDINATTPVSLSAYDITLPNSGITSLAFWFLAYSSAGTSVLTNPQANFIGNYGTGQNPKNVPAARVTCTAGNPSLVLKDINNDAANEQNLNYSCIIQMYYYYEAGTWTINASIWDTDGKFAHNSSKTFTVGITRGWDRNPTTLNWTNVKMGGSSPWPSSNNITIYLTGNQNISSSVTGSELKINASSLNGTQPLYSADQIKVDLFNVSYYPNNPCGSTNGLIENSFIIVNGYSLDHTQSLPNSPTSNDISFCLEPLTNIHSQGYITDINKPWKVDSI